MIKMISRRRHSQLSTSRGFTLIEAMLSLAITVLLLVAILALFDFTNRLSRVQLQLADMQQEQRTAQGELARYVRMAGSGGLPTEIAPITTAPTVAGHPLPDGARIALRANNVVANTRIGDATSPLVYPGTDILTVRGTINTPVFFINYATPNIYQMFTAGGVATTDPTQARRVTIQVCKITAQAGLQQTLTDLTDAIAAGRQEAILIRSNLQDSIFGVAALDPANSSTSSANCTPGDPTGGITLSLLVGSKGAAGSREDAYADLSPAPRGGRLMAALTNAATVAIVEEYRFYVRQEYVNPADNTSTPSPRLARARVYPNTDAPWNASATNLSVDIAENIIDLQVALGIDEDQDDIVIDDPASECGNEWIGDGVGTESSNPLNPRVIGTCKWDGRNLFYVRVSTLARTDRSDPIYTAPMIGQIEDHAYPSTATGENSDDLRHRRRRLLQTLIVVRNS